MKFYLKTACDSAIQIPSTHNPITSPYPTSKACSLFFNISQKISRKRSNENLSIAGITQKILKSPSLLIPLINITSLNKTRTLPPSPFPTKKKNKVKALQTIKITKFGLLSLPFLVLNREPRISELKSK